MYDLVKRKKKNQNYFSHPTALLVYYNDYIWVAWAINSLTPSIKTYTCMDTFTWHICSWIKHAYIHIYKCTHKHTLLTHVLMDST